MIISKRMVSGRLDLLRYMFPNYKVIDEPEVSPNAPCIYIGDISRIDEIKHIYESNKLDYIVYTSGLSDINLNDRITLANIVFEKYKRLVPKYLMNIIEELDEDTFIKCIKIYWVSGKWLVKVVDKENTFLDFIETVNKSSMEMYKSYFNVVNTISPYKLESSIFTFLLRAKNENFSKISFSYKNKLKLFTGRKLELTLIGIDKSLDYNIDNYELKVLNMIICMMNEKLKM